MLSVKGKLRSVIAVDLSNDAITKAVLVSSDGERYFVEGWDYYSEQEGEGNDFLSGQKPEAVTVVLSDAHTLCFAVPDLNRHNLEMEKRKRGLTGEGQFSDYLTISQTGLLATIRKETAEEVIKSVKDTFPEIPQLSISQSMAALHYLYLRSYQPQPEIRTGLVHFAGQTLSLLVAQTEMPVWEGSVELKDSEPDTLYSELSALMQTANEKLGSSRYDLLLLAGDCQETDLKPLRKFASQVELISPFRHQAFEVGRALNNRRREAIAQGHALAIGIASAGMFLERVGLNLANTDLDVELDHEMPLTRITNKEQTALSLLTENVQLGMRKVLPLLMAQSQILVLGVIIALSLMGYRYYQFYKETIQLNAELTKEQQRAESLTDIREQFNEYNTKLNAIKDRLHTIGELRKNQLTVKTVLTEIDSRTPKGLVFDDVDIQETNIKIRGYAPQRTAVFDFANRLGQGLGTFADVAPVYDDKNNIGNYEISVKYVGPIPVNEMALPNIKTSATKE